MAFLDHILTYEDMWHTGRGGLPISFHEFLAIWYSKHQRFPLPPVPDNVLLMRPARINWGRWIVDCGQCNSALMVTPADQTAICVECGFGWFHVRFPMITQKVAIERELLKRPSRLGQYPNSNWEPGETTAQLQAENLAAGIS